MFSFLLLPAKSELNINNSEMYQSTAINEKLIMIILWVLLLKVCTKILKNIKHHPLKINRSHYTPFYQNHEIVSSFYNRVINKLEMFFTSTSPLVRVKILKIQMKINIKIVTANMLI